MFLTKRTLVQALVKSDSLLLFLYFFKICDFNFSPAPPTIAIKADYPKVVAGNCYHGVRDVTREGAPFARFSEPRHQVPKK